MNPSNITWIIIASLVWAVIFGIIIDRLAELIFKKQRDELNNFSLAPVYHLEKLFTGHVDSTLKFRGTYFESIVDHLRQMQFTDPVLLKGINTHSELIKDSEYVNIHLKKNVVDLIDKTVKNTSESLNISLTQLMKFRKLEESAFNNMTALNTALGNIIKYSKELKPVSYETTLNNYAVQLAQCINDYHELTSLKARYDKMFSEENLFDAKEFAVNFRFSYRQILKSFQMDTERLYKKVTLSYSKLENNLRYLTNINDEYTAYLMSYKELSDYRKLNNIPENEIVSFAEIKDIAGILTLTPVKKPTAFIGIIREDECYIELYGNSYPDSDEIKKRLYISGYDNTKPVFIHSGRGKYIFKKAGTLSNK